MIIRDKQELNDENIFTEVTELKGFKEFRAFEAENDDLIFYADGGKKSVIEAMKDEFHASPFECVFFDGWYITLLHSY